MNWLPSAKVSLPGTWSEWLVSLLSAERPASDPVPSTPRPSPGDRRRTRTLRLSFSYALSIGLVVGVVTMSGSTAFSPAETESLEAPIEPQEKIRREAILGVAVSVPARETNRTAEKAPSSGGAASGAEAHTSSASTNRSAAIQSPDVLEPASAATRPDSALAMAMDDVQAPNAPSKGSGHETVPNEEDDDGDGGFSLDINVQTSGSGAGCTTSGGSLPQR